MHSRRPRHVVGVLGPLGGKPGRRPLEDAPDFDGIPDVFHGEPARDEPPGRARLEQPFLGEPVEHQPKRCPRNVQPRRQRHFAQAFAWPERTPENELPHLEERAKGLGFESGAAMVQQNGLLCDRNRSTAAFCMQERKCVDTVAPQL